MFHKNAMEFLLFYYNEKKIRLIESEQLFSSLVLVSNDTFSKVEEEITRFPG